jgi:hypothetical protein
VCCGFLSPLKIHRLGRVLNRQPLGPVASTLTTTPPRLTYYCIKEYEERKRKINGIRKWDRKKDRNNRSVLRLFHDSVSTADVINIQMIVNS